MPGENEVTGSRAGDEAGSVFSRSAPAGPTFDETTFTAFKETLGDLGKHTALEPIKDFTGLTKSFVDAQGMIGGSIRLPKKDATPEEKKAATDELMGKLRTEGILEAIPESPEGYEIKVPTEEGFSLNQPLADSFKKAAHALGASPSMVQGFFDWYLNFQAEADAQERAEFDAMKEGLKTEWGALHTRKMEAARRAVFKHLGEDGDSIISNLPPAIGQKMVRIFASIGEPMLEDGFVGGLPAGMPTRDSIQNKINEIQNNKDHPLHDLGKAGHKEAVEEWTKLQRALAHFQLAEGGK